jgi:hypothetical protein
MKNTIVAGTMGLKISGCRGTGWLYLQHKAEKGLVFDEDAFALAYGLTLGYSWLVNGLAFERCFELARGKDRSQPVTKDSITKANGSLISRRVIHQDHSWRIMGTGSHDQL